MLKQAIFAIFIFAALTVDAQQQTLRGFVYNDRGEPVEFATVALLNPEDTTLVNFAFSNSAGNFEVKNVLPETYLFQISFVGYFTYDTIIRTPLLNEDMGLFVLITNVNLLDAVKVTGERTPLQIKGDTIEYNAAAFKTQPDATAEDLLKKLPGVEVDKSGNIKAQGEDVRQVLVDGKEFFSSDPAVATKNLPADAIDKVQVYDKSSEEAEFTGIDDGARNKTINLLLKEGKKSMWLGNTQAGVGTDDRYQVNGKMYRFTKENQVAGLAMLNNINQFGFSINDYIDFSGGIGAMMSGGGFRIETGDGENMPLNFGGQVDGLITSGALGFNFTREVVPGNRYNVSYLGNGYQKNLLQTSEQQNFLSGDEFTTNEESDELLKNFYHRLNFNTRNKPDSMQSVVTTGSVSFSSGDQSSDYFTENYSSDSLTSSLNSETYRSSYNLSGNAGLNYLRKTTSGWQYLKTNASVNAKTTLSENQWNNVTQYFDPETEISDEAFQDNTNRLANYSAQFSAVRRIGTGYYFEPFIAGGGTNEIYNRMQGAIADDELPVDSLSPQFYRMNLWVKPGVIFKYSSKYTQWRISFAGQKLLLSNTINDEQPGRQDFMYLLPQFSFDKEIRQGRHIRFGYESFVNAPTAIQLLPVTDYLNPLSLYTGNSALKPEYNHNLFFNWMLFDQFSFTSLFTRINVSYTENKINYSKTIHPDLSQSLELVNTPMDISANAGFDFSTPIRPLKFNVRLELNERYNRGINYINGEENTIDAFTHDVSLSFDNRKKDKLDMRLGASLEYTQAAYSIESTQNTNYLSSSLFLEFDYTPVETWRISFDADIDRYMVEGFGDATIIPLLQAEISRYILPSNRGTITFRAYDLLNKNSGISQTAAYNYVQTVTSNSIGRYFMLSFKYRINKAEQNSGVHLDISVD